MRIDKYLKVARKRYYRNQDGRENYKSTGYGDSRTRFEK